MYTRGGSEPLTSTPLSDFATPSLILSNEVCGAHDITPLLIQDLLENISILKQILPKMEIVFFPKIGKFLKTDIKNPAHRQPYRQRSAGIFRFFFLTKRRLCYLQRSNGQSCRRRARATDVEKILIKHSRNQPSRNTQAINQSINPRINQLINGTDMIKHSFMHSIKQSITQQPIIRPVNLSGPGALVDFLFRIF